MYFHANAEDAGMNLDFFHHLKSILRVNILAVEYPGYGIYTEIKQGVVGKVSTK